MNYTALARAIGYTKTYVILVTRRAGHKPAVDRLFRQRNSRVMRRILIQRMKTFVETWGRVPTLWQFVVDGTGSKTVYVHFGSYNRLVEAAGYTPNKSFRRS
jgi:hypothetical protein